MIEDGVVCLSRLGNHPGLWGRFFVQGSRAVPFFLAQEEEIRGVGKLEVDHDVRV